MLLGQVLYQRIYRHLAEFTVTTVVTIDAVGLGEMDKRRFIDNCAAMAAKDDVAATAHLD